MILRRTVPCLRHVSRNAVRQQPGKYGRVQRRYSSSSAGPAPTVAPVSTAAPLASIANELDKLSPRFDIPADSIEILRDPAQFYDVLKVSKNLMSPVAVATLTMVQ